MNALETVLPAGFQELDMFVAQWAQPNAAARAAVRTASAVNDRDAFYAAMEDRLTDALEHLDAKAFDRFEPDDERLMNLVLGFAHCAQAVEVQGTAEAEHAELRQRLTIVRASSGLV